MENAYSCQTRRFVYRPILCNFEYGDAADLLIEDEWKMLTLVARYGPMCSMATGRLVSGQFRCDACMKRNLSHTTAKSKRFLCILVIVDNK